MVDFNGFYRLPLTERQTLMAELLGYTVDSAFELSALVADQMIENYIGNYAIPFGLAPTFTINGRVVVVPMAIEEPSVIAAASNGGKRLGNITAEVIERELIGQIILTGIHAPERALELVSQYQAKWLASAAQASPNMVKRGGGPRKMWAQWFECEANPLDSFLSVYISLDPCDAMGANVMNTILEAITPEVAADLEAESLMSILSNEGSKMVVRAQVSVPVSELHASRERGVAIAKRIAAASHVAQADVHRAVTHNKGIMNGIDAVLIATGNDWRAVESSVHAYAARDGQYRGLSQWHYDETTQSLNGSIELPLPVATVGGTLSVHPTAQLGLAILGHPSANELAEVIAAVGLAQNFAAVRALVTDGIQKGHMGLQARSLALQVGANVEEVPALVKLLRKSPMMNRTVATELLATLRQKA